MSENKPKRETVDMIDGRQFFSDDGWQTVYLTSKDAAKPPRLLTGEAADHARFLAAAQSSAGRY